MAAVVDCGSNLAITVDAEAAVAFEPSEQRDGPGRVAVTFEDDGAGAGSPLDGTPLESCFGDDGGDYSADYLRVHFQVADGDPNATARLNETGRTATFTEANASTDTDVEVVVVAVDGDAETVLVAREETL